MDESLLLGLLFWVGGIVAGVAIGREKGRLVEGIALTAILGIIGVILVAVLPPKPVSASQYGSRSIGAKPPSIPKNDPAKGSMTCGCAIFCVIGMWFMFFGLGFGGASIYTLTDLLFFGSIFAIPAAICTYAALTYFGVSDGYAKMWAVIVFCVMFGATWLFMHDMAAEYKRLRGR